MRRVAGLAVFGLLVGTAPALALSGGGAAAESPASSDDARVRVAPSKSRAVTIDAQRVAAGLSRAPVAGRTTATQAFAVPTPDGGRERFALQRTQVMEDELAADHPEIHTWSGRSLDHPGTTIAVDVTPMGFHASVRGAGGQRAWFVDPAYNRRGTTRHLAYYGAAVEGSSRSAAEQFVEREAPEIRRRMAARASTTPASSTPAAAAKKGARVSQRIYRLALTSDPSYAAYFGSENVLAEKVTLINRVNQIYNDDLGISLRLVNATDALNLDTEAKATGPDGPCGAHPCFDPADPGDPNSYSQLDFCDVPTLGRNRVVLGQLVGASNYDVGHLALGVNGGGIAFLGVAGWDYKGGGCTGLPEPKGDFFAIDYVSHELGHQFGANHTFDGVQYACSGGNRVPSTSVEPGSGSSVMAYAGICLHDDLQPHTDPYFSQRTLDEVNRYTRNATDRVVEVQTVTLRGFGTDGDTVTLGFPGTADTVALTRGTTYTSAGIEAAIETLTGRNVSIAGWAYDPYGDYFAYPAPATAPDDTGFQVIFAPTTLPEAYGGAGDVPALQIVGASPGVSGFVGETAQGGVANNTGRSVSTRNHAPTVKAPATRRIPLRTPFKLKARGSDPDGDSLTYLWEQNDDGGSAGTALTANRKTDGPLFRIFGRLARVTDKGALETPSPNQHSADGAKARVFPDMVQIMRNNTNALTGRCPEAEPVPFDLGEYKPVPGRLVDCFSEFLPTRAYQSNALHFRVTVRDGYPTAGGVGYDDVTVRLAKNAGPFKVTSQKKKVVLRAGSTRKVTWKVNGTRALAEKVKIRLSTNEGKSWRTLAKTTNDGRAWVRIPRVRAGKARIMVEAVGNYFFAVNRSWFKIR